MNRNITVLVYLEYHDESAARKTLDSVFEQQIEGDMQVIVCDLASALEEGIYDYSERDLIYISVKEQMTRFDLEMARANRSKVRILPLSMMGNILQTGNICRER